MKFDFNNLKQMDDLDFEQLAIWPFEVKFVVAGVLCLLVSVLGYFILVNDELPVLEAEQRKETELKNSYQVKFAVAANLEVYQQQLDKLKQDFSSMLKSLPTDNETPGLLDDITYVGTSAGLTFRLLNWQQEVAKEFYTELPIQMDVSGGYHEFGQFVSDIARLPRIVTIHDFDLTRDESGLKLQLQAKTYRTSLSREGVENE